MKKYRTDEQYDEIIDSMINGNWTYAGKLCVEYGFYANDLLTKAEGYSEHNSPDEICEFYRDLVLLAEVACEQRYKK